MSESAFRDDRPPAARGKDHAPRSSPSNLLPILAIGVVVIGLAYVFRPTPTELGVPLSDLQLQPLVGDVQPLELEDLAGKVVLINFWGTWCPPCRIEFPELARMNGRLKADPDFRFIPVTCPPGRDADFDKLKSATEAYYRSEGFDLTAHYDPGGVTRYTLMQDLQLPSFSFPTSVLLDREGAVQGLWVGYQSGVEAQMETKIKKLLR